MTLWDYLRVIRRRLRVIVVVPLFGLVVSYLYTTTLAPRYMTRAQVVVHKNILREGAGLQRGVISNFEKAALARMASNKEVAHLAAQFLVKDAAREFGGRYATEDEEKLAFGIQGSVAVLNVEQSNLLDVSASGTEPVLIADYCNAYARAIVDFFDAERRRNVSELKDYLNAQIQRYTERQAELDARLLALRVSDGRLPAGSAATSESLGRVDAALGQVQDRLEAVTRRLAALKAAVGRRDVDGLLEALPASELARDREKLSMLTARLEDLLKHYTESNPRVAEVKAEIEAVRQSALDRALASAARLDAELAREQEKVALERSRLTSERAIISAAIAALPERMREEGSLQREQSIVSSVIQMFRQRLEDLDLSLTTPADRLEVMETASVPLRPVYPDRKIIVGVGFGMSLIMALALAFLVESLDTSLVAMRDVERLLGKPILAVVPSIQIAADKIEKSRLPVKKELLEKVPLLVDQRSPAAEAYRTLRAVLSSRFTATGGKTLLVTSTTPQEGKTTTITNLALACADAGMKTCLVGANMRHPVVGRHFQIDRSRGLHDVLTGALKPEEALQPTGHANLSIIDSGSFARRPAELLARPDFERLMAWLKERFDIVLIDSPPTLPVADAATMAPKVDAVLLVYLVSVAPRDALIRCKNMLEEVGGRIIGVVFNDIWGASQNDYAGYYYHHKYAGDEFRRL